MRGDLMTNLGHPVAQRRIEQYVALRILVGFLGERDQFNWWDCSFLNATGRKFVTIDYPKSFLAAATNAATEAARRVHDSRIGKGRVFHLFRLPHAMEQKLHRHLLELDDDLAVGWLASTDAALKQLEQMATNPGSTAAGPVQVGTNAALAAPATPGLLAGLYLDAFRSNNRRMPYFAVTET
jgi:hypothetical protein